MINSSHSDGELHPRVDHCHRLLHRESRDPELPEDGVSAPGVGALQCVQAEDQGPSTGVQKLQTILKIKSEKNVNCDFV